MESKQFYEVLTWFESYPRMTVKEIKSRYNDQIHWSESEPILKKLTNEYGWLGFEFHKSDTELNVFFIRKDGEAKIDQYLDRILKRVEITAAPLNTIHLQVAIYTTLATLAINAVTLLISILKD